MKCTILDTKTGITHVEGGKRTFEWTENNWSCDCNRSRLFDIPDHTDEWGRGTCTGCERFIVIKAEVEDEEDYEVTYSEVNSGYPEELLHTWLLSWRL